VEGEEEEEDGNNPRPDLVGKNAPKIPPQLPLPLPCLPLLLLLFEPCILADGDDADCRCGCDCDSDGEALQSLGNIIRFICILQSSFLAASFVSTT
jgi:hypothetical protein